ncbi:MAG: Imm70 family immunity protein [Paracoccaceae bacterium]
MKYGFIGPNTLSVIGKKEDITLFFDLIVDRLEGGVRGSKYPMVTEKLYRKAVFEDDLINFERELAEIKGRFSKMKTWRISRRKYPWIKHTVFDFKQKTLDQVFEKCFKNLCTSLFMSKGWIERDVLERPRILIGTTDIPGFMVYERRSDQEYAEHEGTPFWLQ